MLLIYIPIVAMLAMLHCKEGAITTLYLLFFLGKDAIICMIGI